MIWVGLVIAAKQHMDFLSMGARTTKVHETALVGGSFLRTREQAGYAETFQFQSSAPLCGGCLSKGRTQIVRDDLISTPSLYNNMVELIAQWAFHTKRIANQMCSTCRPKVAILLVRPTMRIQQLRGFSV